MHPVGVRFSLSHQAAICCLLGALITWSLAIIPAAAAPAKSSRSVSAAAAARLVHSPTDNYIAGMEYTDFWQRNRMPLKVYMYPSEDVPGFDSNYYEVFKNACQLWTQATDNMVRFEFTQDPKNADIDVRWVANPSSWEKNPDGHELGACWPTQRMNEGIVHASISILTKSYGDHVGLTTMEFAALHELGHALGLDHSERNSDIMTRNVKVSTASFDGKASVEAKYDILLTPRDITTIKVVYAAKQKLDDIRNKHLDTQSACYELCTEANRQINAGDSGQAIIFLREVLNLDSNYKVAQQNLMAAYFNCGVELYNKQHYSEALPILERSLELGNKVGTANQLNAMHSVQGNCLIGINRGNQSLPSTPTSSQTSYAGRINRVRTSR